MTLPALNQWDATRSGLHQAAHVLAAVRAASSPPLPNALRHSLYPTEHGLTTGPLPSGDELLLDFGARAIVYRQTAAAPIEIPFHDGSQAALTEHVLRALAQTGHTPDINRDDTSGSAPLEVDAVQATHYARALYTVFTGAARFRARLFGPQSPVVVWAHNFDLSTLWFSGSGTDEASDQHMAFGFAPYGSDFPRPYFYIYARPGAPDYTRLTLPPPARVYEGEWTGIVADYDDLVGRDAPEQAIENLYLDIYRAAAPLLE